MITEEKDNDIQYCRNMIIDEIKKMVVNTDAVKSQLSPEVLISIVYLKKFSSYLQDKKFETIDESWKFMQDLNGIVEKIFYVNNYLLLIKRSVEHKKQPV